MVDSIYHYSKLKHYVDYSEKIEKVVVESLQHYGKIELYSDAVKEKT